MKNLKITNDEKLSLISSLGTMLKAGIPILEAIELMHKEVSGNERKLLKSIAEDLNQGKTLAESFEKYPHIFDPITISLFKAAEQAGTMEATLKDVNVNLRKDIEFNDKVKAALTYPILIAVLFVGVLFVILIFVIPRIAKVFTRLDVDIPLPTRILIFISDFILNHTVIFAGLIASFVALVIFLYRVKRQMILHLIFSLPLISELVKDIDLARFTRNMYLMLSSGITVVEALEMSQKVVSSTTIASVIKSSKNKTSSGKNLSESFKESKGVIPGIMVLITEAGERSGTLEKAMSDLNEYFENQVYNRLKTITALLEPIMLIIIGLLVGGIMISVIAPIYGLIGDIGQR